MTIPLTACLCAILLAPASANAPVPVVPEAESQQRRSTWPGQWVSDTFGPDGLEALKTHGYIILQGRPGAYRLQRVLWKSLEAVSRSTKAVQQFSEALPRLKAAQALAPAGPLPFLPLGELPPSGLMTPPLHALLGVMAAYHAEWTALAGPQDETAAAPALPAAGLNLFDTAWGKTFAARTHADIVTDPRPEVSPYFESFLAAAHDEPGAAAHFIGYVQDRYRIDVSSRLAADARAGLASEELRSWLRRYIIDQRRFHALARIRRQVEEMEKKTPLARDLQSFETVAAVFRNRPGLIAEFEGVIQSAPPLAGMGPPALSGSRSPLPEGATLQGASSLEGSRSPLPEGAVGKGPPSPQAQSVLLSPEGAQVAPELTSAGLHLEKPVRLGQYELGDAVVVSGAYWVDGLPEGEAVEVEQTTFRETTEGLRDVQTLTVRRGNGGPYTFARRIVLEESLPFTFRSVISAPSGNALEDSVAVPVAKDFELALLKLAAADNQALACACQDAETSYAKLEESVADAAREKPQYRQLLETARKRRAEAARNAAQQALLEEAIAEARPDSSGELCRYDLKRTEAAMALAKSLPAGCDRHLVELRRQRQSISRHAADQQAFAVGCALAASHRRSCSFALAGEEWAKALAVLDADPAARCGATAEAALQAEADILAARTDELWRAAFAENIQRTEAEAAAVERLRILNPLIARIGTMSNPSCFARERDQAEKLAQAAGSALVLPDALAARLHADGDISGAVAEVAAQRRKLLDEAAALQTKQAAEQAPAAKGTPSLKGSSSPLPEGAAAKGTPALSGSRPPLPQGTAGIDPKRKSPPGPKARTEKMEDHK